jgi:hypothetical protein
MQKEKRQIFVINGSDDLIFHNKKKNVFFNRFFKVRYDNNDKKRVGVI